MKYTKKDIKLYRTINIIFALISILIILFWIKIIGFGLLALSLFFLFRPFTKDEIQNGNNYNQEDLTLDEMLEERNNIGITDDNFTIIAKMISSYYMEFNTPKYKNRFIDEIALYTTVGVLDAQIYVFQEKNITIQQIQTLAKKSLKKEKPLLEFTIGIGILISKAEEPDFVLEDIEYAWNSKRENINRIINEVLYSYPKNSPEEEIVKGHADMFLNVPETKGFRKEIGIR